MQIILKNAQGALMKMYSSAPFVRELKKKKFAGGGKKRRLKERRIKRIKKRDFKGALSGEKNLAF